MSNLLVSPVIYLFALDLYHDVVMVAHDGVGAQVNGKHRAQQLDAIDDPLSAMLEVEACERVRTAQEGTPHASGDAVVIRCVFN